LAASSSVSSASFSSFFSLFFLIFLRLPFPSQGRLLPPVAGLSPLSKCLHCTDPFVADPRNRGRQRFCSKPLCRSASKRLSQRAWLTQATNPDYFKGSHHVQRVREWRARNPGYWKQSRRAKGPAGKGSPSPAPTQNADVQPDPIQASPIALQDPWPGALQDPFAFLPPVFVGFIAIQMGSALQEDIRRHCDVMDAKGREILRHKAAGPPLST